MENIGKKLHQILNNTVHRKLSLDEYKKAIELIATVAQEAREEGRKKIQSYSRYSARFLDGTTDGVSKGYFYLREKIQALSPQTDDKTPTP